MGLNATFQHVLTTALQARWLAALLTGEFKPPSKQDVEVDIVERKVRGCWGHAQHVCFPACPPV